MLVANACQKKIPMQHFVKIPQRNRHANRACDFTFMGPIAISESEAISQSLKSDKKETIVKLSSE